MTSAGKGIDCGLILVDFQVKDKRRLEKIIRQSNGLRFFALNLDEEFDQIGKGIIISIRKTREDEFFSCTTLGPTFSWITVLTAKGK